MTKKSYCTEDPCTACGIETEGGSALHHVKSRGAGGSDEPENLMPLCFKHHTEVHAIGLYSFSEKYPTVKTWLITRDWSRCELTNKWNRFTTKEEVNL